MAENKKKTLHYRRAEFLNSKSNLQNLLSAALSKLSLVIDREENLSNNLSFLRLINTYTKKLDLEFGDLVTYEVGTNKQLLTMNKRVSALNIQQLLPPKINNQSTEFLDGHLFYGIKDNHVIVMQSSLRLKDLESHLNWLLWQSGVMNQNDRVELIDYPNQEIRKKIEKSAKVKSVSIGAPVLDTEFIDDKESTKKETVKVSKPGIGAKVIEAFLGHDEFKKLNLSDAIDGNLKVSLEITYDRTTSQGGQQVINSLARAFRHADADDYSITMPGIGTLKGSDLKLSDSITVITNNGIVDANDLLVKMNSWLITLIERDLVSASS